MKPYFLDDAVWAKAEPVMRSWLGTPYRHLWMKKGRGADCSLFIGAILLELGIVNEVKHEFYPPDWFLHSTDLEIVRDGFANQIRGTMVAGFELVELGQGEALMRGDMPTFCTVPETGVTNHAGIMLDTKTFIHSAKGRGVSEMSWGNYWARCATAIYRVVC